MTDTVFNVTRIGSSLAVMPVTPAKSAQWQLHQELRGQVISQSAKGGTLVRIDSGLYNSPANAALPAGSTLTFKVMALDPQPRLMIVDTPASAKNGEGLPATVVSEQLLKQSRRSQETGIHNLLRLAQQSGGGEQQRLPADTTALLAQLKKTLLKPAELGNAGKLKQALLLSGLFLEAELASEKAADGNVRMDLKALLLRLLGSLPSQENQARHRTLQNLLGQSGLSQYQLASAELPDLPRRLRFASEDALQKIQANQHKSLNESNESLQRFAIDLPLNSQQPPQALHLQIERDGSRKNSKNSDQPAWNARFNIDLPTAGQLSAHIALDGESLSIELSCSNPEAADALALNQHWLRQRLAEGSLELQHFSSQALEPNPV